MVRGASPAVVRALWSDPKVGDEVPCPRCGQPLDFTQPDPLHIGRIMQRCSSDRCPDRVLRALVTRRV